VLGLFWNAIWCVCIAAYHRLLSTGHERQNISEIAKHHVVSHKHARDRAEKHKSYSFARLQHELWRQRIVLSVICPLPFVRVRWRGFPEMRGCYLLKYNGGDSGINIFVLYWRCFLIRVCVIRGSTDIYFQWFFSPVLLVGNMNTQFTFRIAFSCNLITLVGGGREIVNTSFHFDLRRANWKFESLYT
jgi:hypothetical protein